jgi:hypothetical protein
MLAVEKAEIPVVTAVVRDMAASLEALPAEGVEYRHNPCGAPEIYFRKSPGWDSLQRRVVAAVEPLRRGRLREVDPAGERISDVISGASPPDPDRVRQLVRYGYDEVVDDQSDRFRPHLTLTWPSRPAPWIELADLPAAATFNDTLHRLALCEMGPWGTCPRLHAEFPLSAGHPATPVRQRERAYADGPLGVGLA